MNINKIIIYILLLNNYGFECSYFFPIFSYNGQINGLYYKEIINNIFDIRKILQYSIVIMTSP